jgi:class 3 adenylate cyclase
LQTEFNLKNWLDKTDGYACMVFTDIVGSTALLTEVGTVLYTDFRKAHQERANLLRRKFSGILIDQTGDSLFIVFHGAVKAYAFAVSLFTSPGHNSIKIRIGIHYGKVTASGNTLAGKEVHYAARVMQHAKGAELWLSDAAKVLLEKESPSLAESIHWIKSEEGEFKGFEARQVLWHAY